MRQSPIGLLLLIVGSLIAQSVRADSIGAGPNATEFGAAPSASNPIVEPIAPLAAETAWADAEYLLWWMKPVCQKRPLLRFGQVSDSSTIHGAILGDSKYEMPPASGIRATIGFWAPGAELVGWEASGFWLGRVQNSHAFISADGSPSSVIPFTNENNAAQALQFTVPGQVGGRIIATGSSELWGADTNFLWRFAQIDGDWSRRASLLAGFRYVSLRDRINIEQTQFLTTDPLAFGVGACRFATDNEFYGAQVGARFAMERGRWSLEATGKFAPGEMHMISRVSGDPILTGAAVLPGSVPGPLLAFPSNVGQVDRWALAFAQELDLKLRCRLTQRILATLGYNLLYLNRIACPGDQQPQFVNISQLPQFGPLRGKLEPTPILVHTDYFAQGLSAGLEFRY